MFWWSVRNISTKGLQNRRSLGYARDDKGKRNGSMESGCGTEAFFVINRALP